LEFWLADEALPDFLDWLAFLFAWRGTAAISMGCDDCGVGMLALIAGSVPRPLPKLQLLSVSAF
jgi:hypothetical protein